MSSKHIPGELEIDTDRGVIYFHTTSEVIAVQMGTATPLRICRLPKPIPVDRQLDITHMTGCSWKES